MKNPEYVELYVCDDIRKRIEENVRELTRVNHRLYTNKLLFIVSKLHWKQIHHPNDFAKNGAKLRTGINQDARKVKPEAERGTLAWYFQKAGVVKNMLITLKEWGIIKVKHEPVIGLSARTWTFQDEFIDTKPRLQLFDAKKDGAFLRRWLQEKAKKENHPLLEEIKSIYNNKVSMSEEGLQFIQKEYGHFPIINAIAEAHRNGCFDDNREELVAALRGVRFKNSHQLLKKLFIKDYYASLGPQNMRVDHLLTNFKREHRKFMLIDGKPMIETDIVNCQPALSVGLIKKQLRSMYGENFQAEDVEQMERFCAEGRFYEVVAEKAGISIDTVVKREKFKKNRFFPEVYYCKNNNWNTPTQVAFRTLFPNADAAIRELKKKDHRSFAIELQKLESVVIVHTVFTRLLNEGHYNVLPLHDALYTNDEGLKDYAQQLIHQVLIEKYATEVRFKGEVVNNTPETTVRLLEHPIEPASTIQKDQAYAYFTNRLARFVEHLQKNSRLHDFNRTNVIKMVNHQLQVDQRIKAAQKVQLRALLTDYDAEVLMKIPWAA